ncbi:MULTISPECIES: glucosyltransferase domain-containing protein [Citrobacter]|uniref:Glucosyltransferase domain-containing protein n=3 Tax=Citrobacter portucalensis TaxID=1639133 RepID=A0ABZ0H4Z9_9ENTR|nr:MULTISPECIES: glucosyltransferase domain-containing protein [Citrobacter]MBJ9335175.1 glucosyltransferase domain-containing protein [Citrobacter freundii]MDE9575165.1 glucosyltransferase domain-containing protein [Citrobacter portucalensis]MDE9652123.1 glucosyltransferase domain-containing protein [Citrobacter portucalensis]MDM2772869.1 glucosyltransferase domain-containing protein [Citrobacter sp. Cpo126]MEB2741339.1 glucosyltransferase domain-containing protein [Citrobacter portucalensis]
MKNKEFWFIFSFIIMYLIPLLIGNLYYYDDLYRAYLGYMSWDTDGRPFANLFYFVLTFGQTLPDIYPIPLLLGVAFYSYVGFLYARTNGFKFSIGFILSYAMLIMNPLFISNLLFRYDSSFMVIALTLCVVPYSLTLKKWNAYIIGTAALITSFGLYQAAISVFIALAGIELVLNTTNKSIRDAILICFERVSQLIISYLFYSHIILNAFSINDYFKSFNKMIEFSSAGIGVLLQNINSSLYNLKLTFSSGMIIAITPVAIAFLACLIAYTFKNKKLSVLFAVLIGSIAVTLSIPGIAIFGENPVFYSRIYIGLGAALMFITLMPSILKYNNKYCTYCTVILSFYLFTVMSSVMNSVRADTSYQNDISQRIISAINNNHMAESGNIMIIGQSRHSPVTSINILSFPVIKIISPTYFIDKFDGGRFILMHNGLDMVQYPNQKMAEELRKDIIKASPVYADNMFSLFNINGMPVVSFEHTIYDEVNKKSDSMTLPGGALSNVHVSENYFYACINNTSHPELRRNEWYYLLLHMNNGDVLNKNFLSLSLIRKENSSCVVNKWDEAINLKDLKSIEFGIYNTKSMERRSQYTN